MKNYTQNWSHQSPSPLKEKKIKRKKIGKMRESSISITIMGRDPLMKRKMTAWLEGLVGHLSQKSTFDICIRCFSFSLCPFQRDI